MTIERLQSLPLKVLREIARKEGLRSTNGLSRESLIESILEAMEEDRYEREQGNSSAVLVEEKKYEIVRDEELEATETQDYSIPEKYNETKIFFIIRDPLWAFAYWDLKTDDINALKDDSGFEKLYLRVFEIDEQETYCEIIDSFDIPIKFSDNKWYINLPRSGRSYFIAVMSKVNRKERELCRSNTICSPKKTLMDAAVREKIYDSLDNTMLILSGIYDYVESSSFRENIPQRIISMVDSAYMSVHR
jgi:uncharacterized protein